jgi:hypothetical protein
MCGPVQSASLHRLLMIPLLNEQTNAKSSSLLLPLSSHKSHKLSSPSPTGGPTESATIRQTARAMESGKAEAALPNPRAPHRRKSLGWGAGATLTPVFLLQSSLLKLLSTRAVVVGCPCVLTGMPARPAMGRRRAVAESSNSNRSPDSDLIPFCPFDRLV